MATTTLEDLAKMFAGTPDPLDLMRNATRIQEGIQDLIDRLRNVEHDDIRNGARLTVLEQQQAEYQTALGEFAQDRATAAKRLDALEAAPVDQTKAVADLSARVRTLEGAVGSKHFAAKPPAPDISPAPTLGERLGFTTAHTPTV